MHLNHFEALQTVQKLHYKLTKADYDAVDVSVHPPFTDLRTVQTAIESDHMSLILGAQNCHFEEQGAFTGEVSATMLAKLQVRYVIVGHSERRQLFGETDEQVNAKVRAVLASGMTPIMCVGETFEEREAGDTETRVLGQVRAGLAKVDRAAIGAMVVAYEPIWAIGTGRTATPDDAQSVCGAIRAEVAAIVGSDAGRDDPHPVRRLREGGHHRRPDGRTRHRWRSGRGCEPRSRRVRRDRPVPAPNRLTAPR